MRCPPDDDDDNASDDNGENHDETPRRWIVTISLHCYGQLFLNNHEADLFGRMSKL